MCPRDYTVPRVACVGVAGRQTVMWGDVPSLRSIYSSHGPPPLPAGLETCMLELQGPYTSAEPIPRDAGGNGGGNGAPLQIILPVVLGGEGVGKRARVSMCRVKATCPGPVADRSLHWLRMLIAL
mgnify:CR=1 FL=1